MPRLFNLTLIALLLFSLLSATSAGAAPNAQISAWQPNTAYAVGVQVTYNGQTYQCLQAHTSLTGWEPPNVAALWQPVIGPQSTATSITPTQTSSTPTQPPATGTKTPTQPPVTPTKTATPTATLPGGTCLSPLWNRSTAYNGSSSVSWNNHEWRAKWWTQGEEPGTTGQWGVWEDKGACNGVTPTGTVVTPTRTPSTPTVTPTQGTGGVPSLAQAKAREAELTNSDFFRTVKASIRTLDNAAVEAVTPGNPSNPPNVRRVESLVPQAKWNYYFSVAHPSYTYTRFLQAVAKFPAFCGDYTDGRNADLICRRSLATMFAHFTQETGGHSQQQYGIEEWRQGLVYVREIGCSDTTPGCGYNAECSDPVFNKVWTCGTDSSGAFKKYYGRGAKQLSYNYNYGPFSQVMFNGDQSVLLNDPDRVAESWLNLSSAVFFFVFPQPPKPSMLHVVDGTWAPNSNDTARGLGNNFPTTIQIINAECQDSTIKPAAQNRINYYIQFATDLGWNYTQESMNCTSMGRFDSGSSAAFNIYWEKNWSVGGEYQCQLVSYQTPYSALIEGQYVKCVEANWGITLK